MLVHNSTDKPQRRQGGLAAFTRRKALAERPKAAMVQSRIADGLAAVRGVETKIVITASGDAVRAFFPKEESGGCHIAFTKPDRADLSSFADRLLTIVRIELCRGRKPCPRITLPRRLLEEWLPQSESRKRGSAEAFMTRLRNAIYELARIKLHKIVEANGVPTSVYEPQGLLAADRTAWLQAKTSNGDLEWNAVEIEVGEAFFETMLNEDRNGLKFRPLEYPLAALAINARQYPYAVMAMGYICYLEAVNHDKPWSHGVRAQTFAAAIGLPAPAAVRDRPGHKLTEKIAEPLRLTLESLRAAGCIDWWIINPSAQGSSRKDLRDQVLDLRFKDFMEAADTKGREIGLMIYWEVL
ncbi:MAG: hypothetical protein HUJ65_01335 [Oscillospiraceae bacterium]|nr:hypothetical protein [Oscillospiraceae bacterium]